MYREGRKRGREKPLTGCRLHAPNWGPVPKPMHVLWPGIEPATFRFVGQRSIHWTTPAKTLQLLPYQAQWKPLLFPAVPSILTHVNAALKWGNMGAVARSLGEADSPSWQPRAIASRPARGMCQHHSCVVVETTATPLLKEIKVHPSWCSGWENWQRDDAGASQQWQKRSWHDCCPRWGRGAGAADGGEARAASWPELVLYLRL